MLIKLLVRNVNLLNTALLSVAVAFTFYGLSPLLDVRIKYALPVPGQKTVTEKETNDELQTPSVTEYAVISEKNLFHPDRMIPVEKKVEKPLPKPDFVLFGTLITGGTSLAYLEDLKAPRSTTGRGKRQIALKKGDTLSGFTLKEIEADKIIMVRGDEMITLPVNPRDRNVAIVATAPAETPQAPGTKAPPAMSEQRRGELRAAREERRQRMQASREARQQRKQLLRAGQQ